MSIALIREHYDYHRWANRRLFDLAAGLGDEVTRDMGAHWSFPTLKGMFAHIYGADNVWLTRWKGSYFQLKVPSAFCFTAWRARCNACSAVRRLTAKRAW